MKEFRVWRKDRNEWETHNTYLRDDRQLLHLDRGRIMPLGKENHVVQFYSGLNDKNDKMIYEVDIIRIKVDPPFTYNYVREVKFIDGCFCIAMQYHPNEYGPLSRNMLKYHEVIGDMCSMSELREAENG